jgi:16S rRNA (uracil1498-N3)-methyltransferase
MTALPAEPGGTAPHVRVVDVDHPELADADRHHLERVRRLRPGDLLSVTDGVGRWRWCAFGDGLEVLDAVRVEDPPAPPIGVAFALVKGSRPELVVQKLTELGVDRIVPFVAERSVVRWDESKGARQSERLDRIAAEAAAQSRRLWWPVVEAVTIFDDVVGRPGVVAAERGGAMPRPDVGLVMVGPEGGWSDAERERLPARLGLGPTVLRAETAAIAAATILGALRAGTVSPHPER